jgi:hypothetical protein
LLDARRSTHCGITFFLAFLSLQHALTIPRMQSANTPMNEANSAKTSANAKNPEKEIPLRL